MNRRRLFAVLLVVFLLACSIAWYLFRPEKAFINDTVDEPPPPGVPADGDVRAELRPSTRSNAKSLGWSIIVSPSHSSIRRGGQPC
jgi:hypothetical protein